MPTARQREVLALIVAHFRATLRVPTVRELMAATGAASPNGVLCHLLALDRKGLLVYRPAARDRGCRARARAYEVVGLRDLLLPGIDAFALANGLAAGGAEPCRA